MLTPPHSPRPTGVAETQSSLALLRQLYSQPPTEKMVLLATEVAEKSIDCSPHQPTAFQVQLPALASFVRHLAKRAKLNAATFLTAVVYLHRLSSKLPTTARGMSCTRHRIFLAAVLLATKYMNDIPLKNSTWALYSFLFNTVEVNLMERQLLFLLDYNLAVNECELASLLAMTSDTCLDHLFVQQSMYLQSMTTGSPTLPTPLTTKNPSQLPTAHPELPILPSQPVYPVAYPQPQHYQFVPPAPVPIMPHPVYRTKPVHRPSYPTPPPLPMVLNR